MSAFLAPVRAITITDPSTTETPQQLLNDRVYLIGATMINGLAYGIVLCLYASCVYFLIQNLLADKDAPHGAWPRSRPAVHKRKWCFYLVYTSMLSILATIYTAAIGQLVISAYVDNRLFPGGPFMFIMEELWGQPVAVIMAAAYIITLWLTDALVLWRFIMLCRTLRQAKWIIPLPCAMYVGVVVLSCVVLWQDVVFGYPRYQPIVLAFCTLSLSLNILTTLLISACLYVHKRNLERVLGKSSGALYTSIMMMLVESAALYSAVSLLFVILYTCNTIGDDVMFEVMMHVQIIAQLLIILSITRGMTWESRTHRVVSSIRFEPRDGGGETTDSEARRLGGDVEY